MFEEFMKVLCLVDFSEGSRMALRAALEVVTLSKGNVTLVHIIHDQWSQEYQIETSFVLSPAEARNRALERLKAFAEEQAPGVNCQLHVELLPPMNLGKAISRFARVYGADLIVLDRGRARRSAGSAGADLAEVLVREGPCPVLVLRHPDTAQQEALAGKQILLVDDEPDVLESLGEILDMCVIHTAGSFEAASDYLARFKYDAVVLDIMGVNGFDLLAICVERGFPAIMLTAHAVTPDAVEKAIKLGAVFFLPKEKMKDIEALLSEVMAGSGNPIWHRFFAHLDYYFEKRDRRDKETIRELLKGLMFEKQ